MDTMNYTDAKNWMQIMWKELFECLFLKSSSFQCCQIFWAHIIMENWWHLHSLLQLDCTLPTCSSVYVILNISLNNIICTYYRYHKRNYFYDKKNNVLYNNNNNNNMTYQTIFYLWLYVMIKIHLSRVCNVYIMHFLYQLLSKIQEFNLYKSTPLVNIIRWQLAVILQSGHYCELHYMCVLELVCK